MACARSLLPEDSFLCSICLSVFTKPVSTPCGHNFCLDCITNYWQTKETVVQCPLCLTMFYTRPLLQVNTIMAEMASKFKKIGQDKSDECGQAGKGRVLCGICAGAKLEAVRSCLVCFMSYCETHLEPHLKIFALKKHKLIHPVENLESRICETHAEPLELFCSLDQMFVCEMCKTSDHKTHRMVTLEEEAQRRNTQLEKEKTANDQMIQARQQKIQEIQNSVEASRINAVMAVAYSTRVMTAVVEYVQKCQAELTEVIETKLKKTETVAGGFIKELEGEIMQIKQKNLQLNQVSVANDPFVFLEKFLSLTITAPQVNDWSDVTPDTQQFTAQGALDQLQTTVMREISMLCDPDLKEKQRHAVDVTLDPDTANPCLTVSEDGKRVSHGDRKRNLPNKPERFDHVLNVLAKEGFSSGKFYYEVEVKDKTNWDLGVANKSINRKGDIRLSPKNGYWTIWLRKGQEFTANVGPAINLHVRELPQKVGVFVNYDEGEVSFYDVDTRAKIFSFTGCNFTEKIFPYFSPCANDGGKNAAPLIITPVTYSS